MPRAVTVVCRKVTVTPYPRNRVVEAFEAAGWTVTAAYDGPDVATTGVLVLLGNAGFYPAVRRRLLSARSGARPFTVVWHMEPLPPPRASGLECPSRSLREMAKVLLRDPRTTDARSNLALLRALAAHGIPDLLVASSLGRQEVLAEHGLAAEFVPLGWHPEQGSDLGIPRDIDVLFLGDLNPAPRRAVGALRSRGLAVVAVGGWNDPRYWGPGRTELISRAKVFLNVSRNPGQLSGMRFILGMAHRALVISEPVYRPDPYVPGRHYVSATLDDMPDVIRHYLEREDARRAIAEEGHRFVTCERTLAASVESLGALIAERMQLRERIA